MMTASTGHPDELTQLLRTGYDVPPPGRAFRSQLLRRLEAEMAAAPERRAGDKERGGIALCRLRAWWRYGAVAAAAVIIAAGLLIMARRDRMDATPQTAQRPDTPVQGAANPTLPRRPQVGPGTTLGLLSLEDRIGRAPLIVRAKPIGWNGGIVGFAVLHVVYGTCADKTIKLDMSTEIGFRLQKARDKMNKEGVEEPAEADPTEQALAEGGVVKGKDLILFLRPLPGHPAAGQDVKFLSCGMSFDVPQRFSLDQHEKAIIQAIAQGKYLEPHPQPGDVLAERMEQATLIVRATLTKVGDNGATWKIIRTLKGQADKDAVLVDLDLFRLRAEAIVRHALRTGASATRPTPPPSPQEIDARIAREARRLMQAELIPGREAILFVDECKPTDDGVHGRLRHRLYGTQENRNLDELEEAIANPSRVIHL